MILEDLACSAPILVRLVSADWVSWAGGRGVASHRVYPTTAQVQGGVMLLNTGSVDVQLSGTVWPMATATRPSLESLLE